MMTEVPARPVVVSIWVLHPVTWNNGTEMSVRHSSVRSSATQRMTVSMLERKFSWIIMAPLGNPVVPLV